MSKPNASDLSEHHEESTPLDDVLKRLLSAKPSASKPEPEPKETLKSKSVSDRA